MGIFAGNQTQLTSPLLLFFQQLFFQFLDVILQFGILHHQFFFFSDTGLDDCNEADSCYRSAQKWYFNVPQDFKTCFLANAPSTN